MIPPLTQPNWLCLSVFSLCLLFNLHLDTCEPTGAREPIITHSRYQNPAASRQRDENLILGMTEAIFDGDLETVKLILSRGLNINARDKDGWTPLFHAARHGRLNIAKYLIDNGAAVNLLSERGVTPLYLAPPQDDIEMVKLLLAKGADVNLTGDHGSTPLHNAAQESKNVEVVKLLISHGANVNARAQDGTTPLMESCYVPDITKALIEAGAEVDAQDGKGRTALFLTVSYRCYASARILVESGANLEIKNKNGESVWDIARKRQDKKLFKILQP